MSETVRKTNGRGELDALWARIASLALLMYFSTTGAPAIGNGTTAGRLRTTASAVVRVAGVDVTKASTDDLWNLSGETALGAGQYKAYWLYLTAGGVASIAAGTVQTTAALALAALPANDEAKGIMGIYVAGPSTDFTAALAAQGTIHNGLPAGVPIGIPGKVYLPPGNTALVGF